MYQNHLAENLHKKISQMLIIGFNGCSIDESSYIQEAIGQFNIGGVILFEHDGIERAVTKNIKTPSQLKQLTSSLKDLYYSTQTHNQLPLWIGVDYEGGQVTRLSHQLGFPEIPSPYQVAQKGEEYAKEISAIMSETLQTYGFNLVFTPSLDVNLNHLNPIIGQKERSFSEDPQVVTKIATIYQKAFNRKKILCSFKHFPGHGSSTADSHLGFVDVSQVWQDIELIPYQNLISSQTSFQMIMTAHLVNEQLDPTRKPATLSYNILTELLKTELKFKGLVVTDDLQMKAISDQYSEIEACVEAINAGADLLMFGNNLKKKSICIQTLIDGITDHVKKGIINIERIDDAFNRIVEVKQQLL